MANPIALIIDDEEDLRTLMQLTLLRMGIDTELVGTLKEARKQLAARRFDVCLTDMNLPDGNGLTLVAEIAQNYPQLPVAVITAYGSTDTAIAALKAGAFDFVSKPIEIPRLRELIESALKVNTIKPVESHQTPISEQLLIGHSPIMQALRATLAKLARSQAPVYISGESGTGKEVVARLIHLLGPRSNGPFVPVNCGAIPSELMESEFFGHKKGSFTGATEDKQGLFQSAQGGTLFLDEVADLPLPMQVKLLRAIQEKKVRPIGMQTEIPVDIRLLSATHKNLQLQVQAGGFRQDLFYRINVIEVVLPPLRERGEDIVLLAHTFLNRLCADWGISPPPTVSPEAIRVLSHYGFPGNVRELQNTLERALTLSEGQEIRPEHLQLESAASAGIQANTDPSPLPQGSAPTFRAGTAPVVPEDDFPLLVPTADIQTQRGEVFTPSRPAPIADAEQTLHKSPRVPPNAMYSARAELALTSAPPETTLSLNLEAIRQQQIPLEKLLPRSGLEGYLQQTERELIILALDQNHWNRTATARKLGMTFRSLRYRLKKLGLAEEDELDNEADVTAD